MEVICLVRLLTAVVAVRRKRKALVSSWDGFIVGEWVRIAGRGEESVRLF